MELTEAKKHKLGTLCCVAGAASWGISGACSEAFFKSYTVDSAWVTAIRMLAAGVILMAWVLAKRKIKLAEMIKKKADVIEILIFALAGLALCQYAYLSAIRWTNSGTATVLQNLSIVFIAVFVCITTKKLPTKKMVFCTLLALVGVWLIATGGKPGNMEITPRGLFWGMAAAFGAASYSLLSRSPVSKWGSMPVTGLGMLIGGCVLLVVTRAWNIPTGLDAQAVILLAVIVVVGTVGAFTLFLQGINMVGPVKASILACLEPLTATTLSVFWLHSHFTIVDMIGFACILITVVLTA